MGSEVAYKFPQSLSLNDFSTKVRDPSFSSYLNDADGRVEAKLAELTQLATADEEIGVFSADKYFSQGLELASEEKPKESVLRISSAAVDMVSSPVRSKISLGTPSIRSESSSRNSQTALLHSFPTQVVPGRRSTGELVQWKKGFLSRICCRCSCVSKKSLNFEDPHFNSKERRGSNSNMNRADQLLQISATPPGKPWSKDGKMVLYPSATPPPLGKAICSPPPVLSKNLPPNLHTSVKNGSQDFSTPAMASVRKSISLERKLNLLNWDSLNTKSEDGNKTTTISVEYYTDAESDASSDLFEIDSFTGQRKPSFSSQIPDSSASGYATPTTCYAPSEASIEWSVITASAADFSNMSDCEDIKHPNLVPITQRNTHLDLHETRENINYHQKMRRDQFVAFSGVQGQASRHPSSVVEAAFRQAI